MAPTAGYSSTGKFFGSSMRRFTAGWSSNPIPISMELPARLSAVRRPVPAFSCLNSLGCMRNTKCVFTGWAVISPHQHRSWGQKHRQQKSLNRPLPQWG